MLEDVSAPTLAGWLKYSAGKTYKMPKWMAWAISEQGYGVCVVKPEEAFAK